jgi:hypothetical protein
MLAPPPVSLGLTPPQGTPWLDDVAWDTALSPTIQPVDENEWLAKLAFDPAGYNSWGAVLRRPWQYFDADEDSEMAREITAGRFPTDLNPQDDEADAFRHALWTFLMTRDIGVHGAQRFHDAHEISEPNDAGVRLMDLFNSRVGMQLALDPANRDRPAEEVISEALARGMLQTQPFTVKGQPASGTLPGVAPGLCSTYQRARGLC